MIVALRPKGFGRWTRCVPSSRAARRWTSRGPEEKRLQWANRAAFVDVLATGARPLMQAWRTRRAGRRAHPPAPRAASARQGARRSGGSAAHGIGRRDAAGPPQAAPRGGAEIAGGVGDGHVGVLGFDPGGLEVAGVGEQGGTPVA